MTHMPLLAKRLPAGTGALLPPLLTHSSPEKKIQKQNKNIWIAETADSLTSFKSALSLHLGGVPDLARELKGSSTPWPGGKDVPG